MNPDILIRRATADDEAWIVAEVPRLQEFGPPPWRTVEQMNAAEAADIAKGLTAEGGGTSVLVAYRESDGTPLGFVYTKTATDFFTGEEHAHISAVVVARTGEGQGVGKLLLGAAEAWAKSRGCRFITLSVFPENRRALSLYERSGYSTDVIRMLKLL